jgi:hypothetical protein
MCGQNQKPTNAESHDQELERVRNIKHFGFILANDENITTEMLQRFVTNDQTCYGLKEQLSILYSGKGLRSVSMLTYCSAAGPSHKKMKVYSECMKQKYQETPTGKLMKMVYESQGFTMNFISYIPYQKQSR